MKFKSIKVIIGVSCLFFIFLHISSVLAAEEPEKGHNFGQDFTKPLRRLDIRYEFEKNTGDQEQSTVKLRTDVPFNLENGWKISWRFDLPLVHSDVVSLDNPNGDFEAGIGDVLTQILWLSPTQNSWSYGYGVRLIWPTASQDQMGKGKYQLAPAVGAVYYPENWSKGSHIALILLDFFDYAGKDDRSNIHQLSIRPTFSYNLTGLWFVTMQPDIRINFEQDNDVFAPFNFKVGKKLRKDLITFVEVDVPVINDYDRYDWQIGFGIKFFLQ